MNKFTLQNYVDDYGNEPIKIWLKSLDRSVKKRILIRLERLIDGNFGDHKQINELLYELRFDIGSGYRIYYTIQDNIIVLLLNGGDKKSQTKDIKKANEIIEKLKDIKNEK